MSAELRMLTRVARRVHADLEDALVTDRAVAGVMRGRNRLTMAVAGIGALEPSALLEQSGNAIGVAGGVHKYPAIHGALRGGWINVLITDTASARRLAEETP